MKCSPEDTVGDLKKLIAAQTGTDSSKITLKKWYANKTPAFCPMSIAFRPTHVEYLGRYTTYKDHITLADYEIHDGMSLEMY